MIKGVLFDIDGTLVLSNDGHADSWVQAFAKFNHTIHYDDVRRMIGMGGDKILARLANLSEESEQGKAVANEHAAIFKNKYLPNLKPAPGSRELVEKILAKGLKTVVASSARSELLQKLLRAAKVDDLLTEATTSSDVEQSKPDPDIVAAALEKIGLPAQQVLMLGDTPYDIQAAQKCGVGVIAVRCGGWSDQDLAAAVAIYDHPADLLEHYYESLLAA